MIGILAISMLRSFSNIVSINNCFSYFNCSFAEVGPKNLLQTNIYGTLHKNIKWNYLITGLTFPAISLLPSSFQELCLSPNLCQIYDWLRPLFSDHNCNENGHCMNKLKQSLIIRKHQHFCGILSLIIFMETEQFLEFIANCS